MRHLRKLANARAKADHQGGASIQTKKSGEKDAGNWRLARIAQRVRGFVLELRVAPDGYTPRMAERKQQVEQLKFVPDIKAKYISEMEKMAGCPLFIAKFKDGRSALIIPSKLNSGLIEWHETGPLSNPPTGDRAETELRVRPRQAKTALPPVTIIAVLPPDILPEGTLTIEADRDSGKACQ
jgi:hypothetical protein